eukprot:SAG25_NODE_266_length_10666_cov_14.508943_6_plen_104_part_00
MAAAAAQAELEAAAQAEIAEAGRRALKLQAIQQKLAAQKAASEARRAAQEAERAQVSPPARPQLCRSAPAGGCGPPRSLRILMGPRSELTAIPLHSHSLCLGF